MSLVLDALLKAQAQRRRGAVPDVTTGLHTLGLAPVPRAQPQRPPWAWMALAGVLAVALTALTAWAWFGWFGPARSAAPLAVAAQAAVEPVPRPAAQAAPPVPAAAPPVLSPVAPPAGRARLAEPTSKPAPAPAPAPKTNPAPRVATAGNLPAAAPEEASPARASAAVSPSLPSRADLPPAVRQALPALAVSGMVYARDPAQRMVLINGELWRQGDSVAPGLVLEEIRAKDLVLNFQGQQRFSLRP